MTCTPSRLSPSSVQYHNTASNCKTHGAALPAQWAIIGLYSRTCAQKSTFCTQIQSGSDFKTSHSTRVFLTATTLFDDKYLRSRDFCVKGYTGTRACVRAGVCVRRCLGYGSIRKFHGMFSIRPGSGSQRTGK